MTTRHEGERVSRDSRGYIKQTERGISFQAELLLNFSNWACIRRGLFWGVRYALVSIFGVFVRQVFSFRRNFIPIRSDEDVSVVLVTITEGYTYTTQM